MILPQTRQPARLHVRNDSPNSPRERNGSFRTESRALSYPELSSAPSKEHGAEHYDRRADRAFTSSLSRRTISIVLRISASLRVTPIVDAIERNRALSSR